MSQLKLALNQKIEIMKDDKEYRSIIQDVEKDGFSINIPVSNGVYLPLHVDEENSFLVNVEDGGCYTFNGKVVDRKIEKSLYLYKICMPYNITKIQRRDFVRVKAVEYTFYSKLTEEKELSWRKGIIVDLSGGGMKLKIDEATEVDEELSINIIINDDKFNVLGKVVRVDKIDDDQIMCGIQFTDVHERERDKIISKVFQLMRRQRGVL